MRTTILPSFNSTSSMHRVFGDPVESTGISIQENVLSRVLLAYNGVTIRVREFHWKPTFAPMGTVTKRFECYYNGTLVDYSCERKLIVKTFRWLSEKGQIHKAA